MKCFSLSICKFFIGVSKLRHEIFNASSFKIATALTHGRKYHAPEHANCAREHLRNFVINFIFNEVDFFPRTKKYFTLKIFSIERLKKLRLSRDIACPIFHKLACVRVYIRIYKSQEELLVLSVQFLPSRAVDPSFFPFFFVLFLLHRVRTLFRSIVFRRLSVTSAVSSRPLIASVSLSASISATSRATTASLSHYAMPFRALCPFMHPAC